jgi:RNA polymerase sigma-70 factor (ECF subfamily)
MINYTAAVNKNRDAFLKLIEDRSPVLYKIAYSYFKNSDEASDAVQDTVLAAYEKIRDLKDMSKFNSWITTILVNRCRYILRRRNKYRMEEYSEDTLPSVTGSDEFGSVDANIDILNYLMQINEIYRDVIRLKYLGGYKINEISDVLNIPEGTVKSRLNSGIKILRNIMEVRNDGMQYGTR